MSTLPPNRHHHQEDLMRASQINMAVAQPTKAKSASKSSNNANPKPKTQMHRRSRTGLCCFPRILLSLSARLTWTSRPNPWLRLSKSMTTASLLRLLRLACLACLPNPIS